MRDGHASSGNRAELSLRNKRGVLLYVLLAVVVALGPVALGGCAGLVSGNTTSSPPPPSTLVITNVQAPSETTATSQIVWTTNVAADSAVDYGTSTSFGSSTPVDSAMVTSHQVTLSGLAPGTTYYYQVNSTDSNGNHGHSGGHGFKTVGLSISGTINPTTGGSGATLTLSGAASGTTTADNSGNYTFSGLANGTYAVAPSHAGFTFVPSSQSMTVNGANVAGVNFTDNAAAVAPTITAQPASHTVTAGQAATFTVVAAGTAPLSYQWQKNGVNVAGASSASYTTPATTTADSGASFDVVVSNTAGTVTSAAATLTVSAVAVAPTITTQPGNQTVTAGQTATFNVVVAGTAPLSYQWQKNGVNIAGATSTSYTTAVTATSDSGSTFAVVVTNTAGTVTSAAATLTVNAAAVAPTITAQPGNQTVTTGQTATFTLVAAGTAPLSYQWQKNGANIAGATAANYTTPATTTADSGTSFDVVVSNTAGTVTSSAATLTVNPAPVAPTITTQPVNQTVTAGQTATFNVAATGTAPLSYQWRKNGVNIAGATAAGYTTPATTTSDSGATFTAVVSNTAGTVTSAAATLTVNAAVVAPTITTQPGNQTATFNVVATGTTPLSYQWQKNGVNIAGATATSYTTPVTATSDSGSTFAVVVTNTAGTVTSAAATLTVTAAAVAPTITTQPANQTVTAGQTATFNVVATGTAPLSYQWQKNGVNIAGATATSYTTPVTATSDSGSAFRVIVSNTAGTVTSSAATLTVNPAPVAPTITTQPGNQTVTAGQAATFNVVATGTAPLSYQWQKNGVNIAGATAANYTTPATTTADSGTSFDVVVSNTAGTATSAAATLTVNPAPVAPTITTQPGNQTVTGGQTATFTVVAAGTAPLSYQWQKNGVNIAGATATSYTTPLTATSDSGSTFDVVVSNTAGTVTSATATLTVNPAPVAPSITTQPANQTVTAGQAATFAAVATGTAPLSYQWQKNGVNIAGATATSYTTPATTTTDSGSTFRLIVSNTAGTVTSAVATLTVNPAPVAPSITTQPANQTVTAGQTATFTVVAAGTVPLSYQWQKNGVNVAGATSASYTSPATTTSDSGATFDVVVSNTAGTVTSAAATLTVNPAPAPAIQTNPTSINFASGVVGTGLSQPLIIKNTGTATLNITQVNETGSAFSVSGFTLPLNVNAGQQTTITVAFLPTVVGTVPGNISIVSNAPTSPTSVGLSGTGVAATLTLGINPTSLSFGNVTTGTSSAAQSVTITNTGNSSVTISQINLSADYSMTGGSAPVTLTPSQNLTLSVRFSPTTAVTVNGSISIVSNATGSPATVTLSGTGVAPVQHSVALTWSASTSTVSGYNVYRDTVSGGPYTKINPSLVTVLNFTDSTVQSATTYFYVTTAVDSSGNESVYSNEVTAPIP
jgi:hypothetical protein